MKKTICVLTTACLLLLMLGSLYACAPQDKISDEKATTQIVLTEESVQQNQPETTGEPAQTEGSEHLQDARKAFQQALQTIHDELVWPELPDAGKIELFEPGTIEDELFAVLDVDWDGQEELLVSVSNTYMAGMRMVIYSFDSQTDGVRVEAQVFPSVTVYPGILKVEASHNQGYAGDVLWPYAVLRYDEEQDTYTEAIFVNAWSKEISEFDHEGNPYPEDIDTEHDGYVYLITENGQQKTLNRA
ncbi:MAG: hypothetical protein ACI4FY_10790, partial [Acetatifactor sp.]